MTTWKFENLTVQVCQTILVLLFCLVYSLIVLSPLLTIKWIELFLCPIKMSYKAFNEADCTSLRGVFHRKGTATTDETLCKVATVQHHFWSWQHQQETLAQCPYEGSKLRQKEMVIQLSWFQAIKIWRAKLAPQVGPRNRLEVSQSSYLSTGMIGSSRLVLQSSQNF